MASSMTRRTAWVTLAAATLLGAAGCEAILDTGGLKERSDSGATGASSSGSGSGSSSSSSGSGSGSGSGGSSGSSTSGSSTSSGGGSGSGSGSSSGSSSGGSSGGDAGTPNCGANTPTLHPGTAGNVYCLESTCAIDQQCCLGGALDGGGFAADECAGFGASCTNPVGGGIPVECNQNADCSANGVSGGAVCCLRGGTSYGGCQWPVATGGQGIFCEAPASFKCPGTDIQICEQDTDCSTGYHCIPGRWKTLQVGFCQ
jgi:hypothetical protein